MFKKEIFLSLLLLTFFCQLHSQEKKMTAMEILTKATDVYNKQQYLSCKSKYTLYLDYTTKKIYEQYSGIVLRKNNVSYFKIKNTEFVSFNDYGLKIDNEQKALVVEKGSNAIKESPLSMSNYLTGFTSKLIDTDKDYFICELKPGKISQVMLSKVLIRIKRSDYSIVSESLFLVEKMESKGSDGETINTVPRLEIAFSPRKKEAAKDNLLVSRGSYFSEKANNIILSKRLAAYKLYKS